ncbi:MAG: ABC transporter permease, partial [Bacteroidota bacterium]
MFAHFFLFEIKYRLQRPMVYLFLVANFIIVFAATVNDHIVIGGSNDSIHVNAPYVIMKTTLLMTLVGIFMTTALVDTAILRDFTHRFSPLIFSTPIRKISYLSGRFTGAFLMALLPFLGIFAGIALGAGSGLVSPSEISSFSMGAYWNTFLMGVVPNILLVSAIIFWLAATFRSSIVSFLGAVSIVVLYIVLLSFSQNLDNETIAILADPLGINSYNLITKYWTIAEKNTQVLPFSGLFLLNRIIWFSVSIGCLLAAYFQFSFTSRRQKTKTNVQDAADLSNTKPIFVALAPLPAVQLTDNFTLRVQQFLNQIKIEFWSIFKSAPFIVLLLLGIFNMLGSLQHVSELRGTGNYPVTYLMVEAIRGSLYLFLLIMVLFYSGVLVWKERENNMNEIYDVAPYPTWLPFSAKLVALMGMTVTVLLLGTLCGALVQLSEGYTQFQWSIYFREFLVYDLAWLFALSTLAMLIQTLVNNKYIGYFGFILLLIAFQFGPKALSFQSHLIAYASVPTHIYSDMNAWSLYATGLAWFHTYWTLAAAFLAMITV